MLVGHETQTSMGWKFQMHDARTHARSRKCEDMPLKKSALILFRTLFLVSFRFVLASNALWPFRYDINSIHNPMRLENVLMLSRSVFFLASILISIVSCLCLPSLRLYNLLRQFVLIIIITNSTRKKMFYHHLSLDLSLACLQMLMLGQNTHRKNHHQKSRLDEITRLEKESARMAQ